MTVKEDFENNEWLRDYADSDAINDIKFLTSYIEDLQSDYKLTVGYDWRKEILEAIKILKNHIRKLRGSHVNMSTINNWSIIVNPGSPYIAPEMRGIRVCGNVKNHTIFNDGDDIRTSPIENAYYRIIHTFSGNIYRLGKIDPKYRKWLKKNRPNWDWRQPITLM